MTEKPDFFVSQDQHRLEVRFPSLVEHINRVEEETRRFLDDNGLSGEAFPVCLVMRESLLNAVKHGNRLDPRKMVKYTIEFTDDILTMEVEDQGEGFDWRSIPRATPSGESEKGRGIFIMRRYFSKVQYNGKGNKLTLTRVSRPDRAAAGKRRGTAKQ